MQSTKVNLPPPYVGQRPVIGELHCHYCAYSNKYKSRLIKHMERHLPPEYVCTVCRKPVLKSNRANHALYHSTDKPFKCDMCEYAGKAKSRLRVHMIRMHGWEPVRDNRPSRQSFKGVMNATSTAKFKNKVRKAMPLPYTGPRLGEGFHCYYCPKTYTHKYLLRCHMYSHLPLEIFCWECGSGFRRWHELQTHRRNTHLNQNLYECHLCDFKTKWKDNIGKHLVAMHRPTVDKPKPEFSCYYCGWSSKFRCRLVDHMYSHVPQRINCPACDYRAPSRSSLLNHTRLKHSGNILKCEFCRFQTIYPSSLKVHMVKHSGLTEADKIWKCSFCDFRAPRFTDLKVHSLKHTGEKKHACNFCDFRCATRNTLRVHVKLHSNDVDFTCPICSVSVMGVCLFADHLETEHPTSCFDDKPYACQLCGKACETVAILSKDLRSHRRERSFQCPHCPYATFLKTSLTEHIKVLHSSSPPLHACSECDFKTLYRSYLRVHMEIVHVRSKWLSCQFCKYRTLLRSRLTIHERIHTDDKPYACDMCDYRALRQESLKTHKLRHLGETAKGFKCDSCDFTDFTRAGLTRHKQSVHAVERPFKCDFCPERFKTQQTARAHLTRHTGENLLSCELCSYQTVSPLSFKRHMSAMHPAEPVRKELPETYPNGRRKRWYGCEKCAFLTCNKPSLARHMKERHPKPKRQSEETD